MRSIGVGAFDFKSSIEEALRGTMAVGVHHCELAAPQDVTRETARAVARLASDLGIVITAVATLAKPNVGPNPHDAVDSIRQTIDIAAALSAPRVITYFGANPHRTDDEAIGLYAESMLEAISIARDLGIELLIENHFNHAVGDVTSTVHGCRRLLEAVDDDAFGLNFDTCNFAISGEDPHQAYEDLREYVRNVHVKDATPYDPSLHATYDGRLAEDLNRGRFIFTAVDSGITDNRAVLERIRDDGLNVPITVEAHVPKRNLNDVLAAGVNLCMQIFE